MGLLFYNLFLFLFKAAMPLVALFNPKAKKWVEGRKGIWERLTNAIGKDDKVIWVHCASLGEFEQGRPLIDELKKKEPSYRILLTFFSPSGYEIRKNYPGADWVFYLPMDGARSARRFLEITHPDLVIFIKYEFWYYYLKKIKYRQIPIILVSALFWEKMSFFKWYGGLQRKMLSRFDHLFVQNKASLDLMKSIGLEGISTISGDTRFDRVIEIASQASPIPEIARFIGNNRVIVAGSTWPTDESILAAAFPDLSENKLQLIIAPHEITEKHLDEIFTRFPEAIRFSQWQKNPDAKESSVLVIDSIGLLSRLYQYSFVSYIGGGFGKGIHNTLEAAVYGRPVLFGPVHQKFKEATDLKENGAAICIHSAEECRNVILSLLNDPDDYLKRSRSAKEYVSDNKGATHRVLQYIQEKRLLTS